MKLILGFEDLRQDVRVGREPKLKHFSKEAQSAAEAAEVVIFDVMYQDRRHGRNIGQIWLKKAADHPGPLTAVLEHPANQKLKRKEAKR